MDDLKKIVGDYETLLAKAKSIVDKAPYWHFIHNSEYAVLSISDEDIATLLSPDVNSDYDSYSVDEEAVHFPAKLLRMSDSEIEAWKASEREKYDLEQARLRRENAACAQAVSEARDRSEFERLKKKFG